MTEPETRPEAKPVLLLVDDEVINLDILIETLGEAYNVRVATSGAAALESVRKFSPELILLDVMMPGMDGFEVCRCLKANPATQDIPIIFLTALHAEDEEERGLDLGAADYITKPFSPAIVRARIRNHLELNAHRRHLARLVAQQTYKLGCMYDQLLNLDRLKDDFLGMLSHEIRTPANGVLGIGEMLIDLCPASADLECYSALFRKSSSRLHNLIEDTTLLVNIENMLQKEGPAIAFSTLLSVVQESLREFRIIAVRQDLPDPVLIRGDLTLLKRGLEATVLLASSFCRDRLTLPLAVIPDESVLRLHFILDNLLLSEEQAAGFFELASDARSASTAESLGLTPVVAHKIFTAFGGDLGLVKGTGNTGYIEILLKRG